MKKIGAIFDANYLALAVGMDRNFYLFLNPVVALKKAVCVLAVETACC